MKLQAASEAMLIELTDAEDINGRTTNPSFLSEAQDLYKMEAFSKSVVNWNKLRSDAVEMAFRKEMIHKIREEAIEGIKRSIQRTLYEWIQWAPYVGHYY